MVCRLMCGRMHTDMMKQGAHLSFQGSALLQQAQQCDCGTWTVSSVPAQPETVCCTKADRGSLPSPSSANIVR